MRNNLRLSLQQSPFATFLPALALGGCLPAAPDYGYSQQASTTAPQTSVVVPASPAGGTVEGTVAAGVRWRGRVDLTTDPANPYFGWTASGFDAKFTGTSIGVKLNTTDPNAKCQADPCGLFFQAVVDGKPLERMKATPGVAVMEIASGLTDGPHTLEFYRETESPLGKSQFLGITGGTLLPPPTYSGRLVEFVADSITNGFGELGMEDYSDPKNVITCPFTLDTQAGYLTYAAKVARALNADASIVALSGWGLYRGLSLDGGDGLNFVVPNEYEDSLFYLDPQPKWDFRVKANAVVINLGTNDVAMGDPGPKFTEALQNLVDKIRSKNPDAWIFPVTGTMLNGQGLDWVRGYFKDFVDSKGGDAARMTFVDMGSQDLTLGSGCITHPSEKEHQRMVEVLYPVMKEKLGW
ncbi:MAG: SGNH/GDSL hydrolase family protein [Polyangiaceae bacterium]|nr:SGNH/GDSL hydrolase family protein [Polyangiaceae bacterium]